MKKFIPFLSFVVLFAACTSRPEAEVKTLQGTNGSAASADTAGLAQFQQWKAQNELAATDVQQQITSKPPENRVTVIRERIIEKPVRVKQPLPDREPVINNPGNTENTGTSQENTGGTTASNENNEPAVTPEADKKEGWSKAAKGAVIGGAGGAVLGAIINKKNPAVGAAIGGVLGGAVGYGVGRGKDKKDGRY